MYDSWDVGYLLALPSPAVRFVIVPFAFDFVVDNIVLCIPCVQSRTATSVGERDENETLIGVKKKEGLAGRSLY